MQLPWSCHFSRSHCKRQPDKGREGNERDLKFLRWVSRTTEIQPFSKWNTGILLLNSSHNSVLGDTVIVNKDFQIAVLNKYRAIQSNTWKTSQIISGRIINWVRKKLLFTNSFYKRIKYLFVFVFYYNQYDKLHSIQNTVWALLFLHGPNTHFFSGPGQIT